MRNFAIRTMKDGQVKINGKTFAIDEYPGYPYQGQLEAKRLAFGLYWKSGQLENFTTLWGTEEYYHAKDISDEAWRKDCDALTVDGVFVWMIWREVAA